MRILVTNDDGVHAPGLKVLEAIARQLSDDVWVIAPETDQSGVSHSLSLNDPLRLREISSRHFAVKGTPTDCVIMGTRHVMNGSRPDLVLSGVNRGQNVAEDVTYSGRGPRGRHPRRAVDRPVAGLRSGRARRGQVAMRRASRRGRHPARAGRGHPARNRHQRQLPRLRAGRGARHRRHGAGAAGAGDAGRRRARRRARQSFLLDRLCHQGLAGRPRDASSASRRDGRRR